MGGLLLAGMEGRGILLRGIKEREETGDGN